MPDGFVIEGDLDLRDKGMTELPDLSKVIVKGDFNCSKNRLKSLKGSPQTVAGNFSCIKNKLTSLEGVPQKIGGSFFCTENKGLNSLLGIPQMKPEEKVYCDIKLRKKYDLLIKYMRDFEYERIAFPYRELLDCAAYKSELSTHKIRLKKQEEKKIHQEKFQNGFKAFKKKFCTERE